MPLSLLTASPLPQHLLRQEPHHPASAIAELEHACVAHRAWPMSGHLVLHGVILAKQLPRLRQEHHHQASGLCGI
jgi:hypothetical protein